MGWYDADDKCLRENPLVNSYGKVPPTEADVGEAENALRYSNGRAISKFTKDILIILVVRHLKMEEDEVRQYFKDMLVDLLCDYVSLSHHDLVDI